MVFSDVPQGAALRAPDTPIVIGGELESSLLLLHLQEMVTSSETTEIRENLVISLLKQPFARRSLDEIKP